MQILNDMTQEQMHAMLGALTSALIQYRDIAACEDYTHEERCGDLQSLAEDALISMTAVLMDWGNTEEQMSQFLAKGRAVVDKAYADLNAVPPGDFQAPETDGD